MTRRPMRSFLYALAILALNVPLAGCVVASRNPEFPPEWAPLSSERIGSCPLIAGRYVNDGELYITSESGCESMEELAPGAEAGVWNCSQALSANLGLAGEAAAVELHQPDEQTLEVTLQDAAGATLDTQRLRLSHDYSCDADSLYFSGTSSMLGGPVTTAFGILLLSGGVLNHSRAFTGAAEGSLVMTVRERMALYHIIVGGAGTSTSYVRWPSAPAMAASAPP